MQIKQFGKLNKMVDLKLNIETHDLEYNNYDLVITKDENIELIQRLKIKLQFFFAEWFLDTTKGVQFYEIIYKKNSGSRLIDNVIKRTILEEQEISNLIEYKTIFDLQNRKYSINFIAKKYDGGIIKFKESIIL